jgi:putative hydrolase of the HAD superfamily
VKRCLVFDLDDTLYLERLYALSGFGAVDRYLNESRKVAGFYSIAEEVFEQGARGDIFNVTLRRLGIEDESSLITDLVGQYRCHEPDIALLDDAHWALENFSGSAEMALLTDGFADAQRRKINALDISKYFKKIVVTDELGRDFWKPCIASYRIIEEYFEVNGSQCVYVADNPKKDFVAPNKLGWDSVRIIRDQGEYRNACGDSPAFDAKATISTLRDLPEVL